MRTANDTVSVAGHVCTIKAARPANGVLVALMAISVAAVVRLLSALFAGHWLADALLVEGTVAGVTVPAFAMPAWVAEPGAGCTAATRQTADAPDRVTAPICGRPRTADR